jgi:hypothetical protein
MTDGMFFFFLLFFFLIFPILGIFVIALFWCWITIGLLKIEKLNRTVFSISYGSFLAGIQLVTDLSFGLTSASSINVYFLASQLLLVFIFLIFLYFSNKSFIGHINFLNYIFVVMWCLCGGIGFYLYVIWFFCNANKLLGGLAEL